jgi:hypothetical protein
LAAVYRWPTWKWRRGDGETWFPLTTTDAIVESRITNGTPQGHSWDNTIYLRLALRWTVIHQGRMSVIWFITVSTTGNNARPSNECRRIFLRVASSRSEEDGRTNRSDRPRRARDLSNSLCAHSRCNSAEGWRQSRVRSTTRLHDSWFARMGPE